MLSLSKHDGWWCSGFRRIPATPGTVRPGVDRVAGAMDPGFRRGDELGVSA